MEPVSRRRLLAASGGAILAGTFLGTKSALALDPGPMPVPSPWSRRWDVMMNVAPAAPAAEGAPAAPAGQMAAGAFTMAGTVFPVTTLSSGSAPASAVPVGTARATGWVYDAQRGRSVTNLIIEIDTQGSILLSGIMEGTREDTLAIIGGTERFKDARGEAWIGYYNRAAGAMRIDLNMTTI